MQTLAISACEYRAHAEHLSNMHQLRAKIFSGRLGWDVSVGDGRKADEFDELRPTYILALADSNRVVGCARLLPALGPTMLEQTFPQLWATGSLNAHAGMIESSRFCVDTSLRQGRGCALHQVTLSMWACRKLPQRPQLSLNDAIFMFC